MSMTNHVQNYEQTPLLSIFSSKMQKFEIAVFFLHHKLHCNQSRHEGGGLLHIINCCEEGESQEKPIYPIFSVYTV